MTLQPLKSLRVTLQSSIISLVILIILFSSYLSTSLYLSNSAEKIEKSTQLWAQIMAERSVNDLLTNNHEGLDEKLTSLKDVPFIHYIHVYKRSLTTDDITFFTSYNLNNTLPPIPDKITQIAELSTLKVNHDYIELVTPILHQKQTIGYLYIQASKEEIHQIKNNQLLMVLLSLTIAILVGALIALKVEQLLTSSIDNSFDTINRIIKEKDYTLRCQPPKFKELGKFSYNLNLLLQRTQKHLEKVQLEKDQATQANEELKDKISDRNNALKESNDQLLATLDELHKYQKQLVENEKMASLGDMVAGVAHEVNTPIGLGVTSSSIMSDRLTEVKTAFENKTLRSSQLKSFLDEGQENINIIVRNLNRAANLISSFKKLSVNQANDNITTFNVKELFDEVLLTLAPQINNTAYVININCAEELSIYSKPGPINQILINLIFNSIIHGFENKNEGTITINVMTLGKQLHIQYQDNGVGIPEELKAKVFDPFITTNRSGGGSGLGLHLVYNLVTQSLGGTISLESKVGHGVNFDINFPLSDESEASV